MKKVILKIATSTLLAVTILTSCGATEESKETNESMTKMEFKVFGNCGMCEKTIEASLNGQEGIGNADWDKESKMITVTYDSEAMNEDKIKTKIAEAGYDTNSHRAEASVYSALPGCCQYDRPE